MTPYYDDGTCVIYHGDCREVEAWLDADVVVTDPPYGIGWSRNPAWTNAAGGGGYRSSGQAVSIVGDGDLTARDEMLRKWGNRPAVVFGDILKPAPAGTVHVLIYAKPFDAGIMGARAGRRKDVEAVFLVGPSWPTGIGGRSSVITSRGTVAGPRGVATRAGHPHAKPQDVMAELIELAPGAVADPFMGSGSTLVAAKALGRRSIGVELDERYCEIAARRLSQEVLDFGGAA